MVIRRLYPYSGGCPNPLDIKHPVPIWILECYPTHDLADLADAVDDTLFSYSQYGSNSLFMHRLVRMEITLQNLGIILEDRDRDRWQAIHVRFNRRRVFRSPLLGTKEHLVIREQDMDDGGYGMAPRGFVGYVPRRQRIGYESDDGKRRGKGNGRRDDRDDEYGRKEGRGGGRKKYDDDGYDSRDEKKRRGRDSPSRRKRYKSPRRRSPKNIMSGKGRSSGDRRYSSSRSPEPRKRDSRRRKEHRSRSRTPDRDDDRKTRHGYDAKDRREKSPRRRKDEKRRERTPSRSLSRSPSSRPRRTRDHESSTGNRRNDDPPRNESSRRREPRPRTPSSGPERADLYAELGVNPTDPYNKICAAYRVIIRKYHPDKWASKSPEEQEMAAKRAAEINHAHDILKDEDKRRIYDRLGITDELKIQDELKKDKGKN